MSVCANTNSVRVLAFLCAFVYIHAYVYIPMCMCLCRAYAYVQDEYKIRQVQLKRVCEHSHCVLPYLYVE